MTATSMTRPPASEKSRNFIAAYCRRGTAEAADEEVDRDEHRLEEDVEEEDVGGGEDADHERLEHEHQREVGLGPLAAAGPASSGTSCQAASRQIGVSTSGHEDEHEGDAVDAERVADAELRDPRVLLTELELRARAHGRTASRR